MPNNILRVVGIDPGFERLGIACLEKENSKETLITSGCIRSDPKLPHQKRLFSVGEEVKSFLEKFKPTHVAIEDLFFSKNQKTAMEVAEVVGVVRYLASTQGITVFEYTPSQIKIAVTGYGKGSKEQVTEMVKRLIHIPKKNILDDEYDAIAIGLTHLASFRENREKII